MLSTQRREHIILAAYNLYEIYRSTELILLVPREHLLASSRKMPKIIGGPRKKEKYKWTYARVPRWGGTCIAASQGKPLAVVEEIGPLVAQAY